MNAHKPYQICSVSVMDTTDSEITFNEEGVSNHVIEYQNYIKNLKPNTEKANKLRSLMVKELKKAGKNKDYDCIIGLSGGVDSSYVAWYVTKILRLRPLIVHVDAGWNNEIAVHNIENIVNILDLDLHTVVLDWSEIKDLQLAYFKSSLANIDVPQDHAIIKCVYNVAIEYNIKYIVNGNNMSTESILPSSWGYDASDSIQIKDIHKKFGTKPLSNYPLLSFFQRYIYYPRILKIKSFSPLDWIDYNKGDAKKLLIKELNWKDYGGKHYESKFTKFFQAHYLPIKFNFDKRKAHLSSLILTDQISREEALSKLKLNPISDEEAKNEFNFVCKKLEISENELTYIMNGENKSFKDYKSSYFLIQFCVKLLRLFKIERRLIR